ncbi:meiotic recombination protein REC114 isoform X2 [Vicugna pacos]|uniref:Meiotic recombination protein REC114 isoform X2 n=1 Tax=Vicugna pacos TaxID=30538 RepID=A0ABM5CEU2_VICPA
MAEAGREHAGLGLFGRDASQWPLQRYGRFMPSGTGEPPGPGLEAGTASSPTWKVFDSNEESGHLVLTIVISGHFFISQGQTLLNKSRMFRVQFGGDSKARALEHCCGCVQALAQYVPVQAPDGVGPRLGPHPDPLRAGPGPREGCVWSVPLQRGSHGHPEQQQGAPAGSSTPGGRTSLTWLAQCLPEYNRSVGRRTAELKTPTEDSEPALAEAPGPAPGPVERNGQFLAGTLEARSENASQQQFRLPVPPSSPHEGLLGPGPPCPCERPSHHLTCYYREAAEWEE